METPRMETIVKTIGRFASKGISNPNYNLFKGLYLFPEIDIKVPELTSTFKFLCFSLSFYSVSEMSNLLKNHLYSLTVFSLLIFFLCKKSK